MKHLQFQIKKAESFALVLVLFFPLARLVFCMFICCFVQETDGGALVENKLLAPGQRESRESS